MIRYLLHTSMVALFYRQHICLCNIAEGTHEDTITKLADAAQLTRFLLVKAGSDAEHIAVNGANDLPLGVCPDEPSAAEAEATVQLFGCARSTRLMVASKPIAANVEIFTAAAGKVQDAPVAPGTYYRVGRALRAVGADGDVFEVDPYPPQEYIVT
jgi:hypothetical protein